MSADILVDIKDIKQYFKVEVKNKKANLKAVDGVSLQIRKGETFGLVGESGCGKSTLGKSLLHLHPLTSGSIIFDGENISHLKGKELKKFRCQAQMIFQDPASCLNPRRKIVDILMEPYVIHGMYDKKERLKKAQELCDKVGLSQTYLSRYPHEMSGGQKQRIGIARALALSPKLIVCDEPVSALDVSIQAQVINLLGDLQKAHDLTYLFISHDLSVVKYCCDRIGVMYLGRMVELAPSYGLYEKPLHPYTQLLISSVPSVEGGSKEFSAIIGDIPSPISPPNGCTFHTRCPKATEKCKTTAPQMKAVENGHFVSCHLY